MACKLLTRSFFFEREILSASTNLSFTKSPITCFNAVANMKSYPDFIPWIKSTSLTTTSPTTSDCKVTIGYPPFNQSYLSKVTLTYPTKIVSLSNNDQVFELLESVWEFHPDPTELISSSTQVHLYKCKSKYSVKFKFTSIIYQQFASMLLNAMVFEISQAFITRVSGLENVPCVYDKSLKNYINQ